MIYRSCPYCTPDSAGKHEYGCPNYNYDKVIVDNDYVDRRVAELGEWVDILKELLCLSQIEADELRKKVFQCYKRIYELEKLNAELLRELLCSE